MDDLIRNIRGAALPEGNEVGKKLEDFLASALMDQNTGSAPLSQCQQACLGACMVRVMIKDAGRCGGGLPPNPATYFALGSVVLEEGSGICTEFSSVFEALMTQVNRTVSTTKVDPNMIAGSAVAGIACFAAGGILIPVAGTTLCFAGHRQNTIEIDGRNYYFDVMKDYVVKKDDLGVVSTSCTFHEI